jgi:superoxide reductase
MAHFRNKSLLKEKKEQKHLPLIEAPNKVKRGENFDFEITVNQDMTVRRRGDQQRFWITVYFLPQESSIAYKVVQPLSAAQKEVRKDSDSPPSPILYKASFQLKTEKAGTIYAAAYCPIHGLSQSRTSVEVI